MYRDFTSTLPSFPISTMFPSSSTILIFRKIYHTLRWISLRCNGHTHVATDINIIYMYVHGLLMYGRNTSAWTQKCVIRQQTSPLLVCEFQLQLNGLKPLKHDSPSPTMYRQQEKRKKCSMSIIWSCLPNFVYLTTLSMEYKRYLSLVNCNYNYNNR